MNKKYRAIALFSGGLDSIIAVKWMEKLGVEVIPTFFETPFFKADRALYAAKKANLEIKVIDISDEHIEMMKAPKYGFGKNMNPCIDCHGLMFRTAAKLLKEWDADFLISGEVLGQRPMSQRKNAMNSVRKLSEVKDLIVRPLCQKLIEDTLPIREGWINKDDLLDIQGRSRVRQIELAEEFDLKEYQSPGGGCTLTEPRFAERLKDIIKYDMFTARNCEFLKYGRHYRISENIKLIIGRKHKDNEALTELCDDEIVLKTAKIPGPLGFIQFKEQPTEEEMQLCAGVVLRYNNKAPETFEMTYGKKFNLINTITVKKITDDVVQSLNINARRD